VKQIVDLSSLGIVVTEDSKIDPSGGMDFGAGQLIGPFQASIVYSLMSKMSYAEYAEEYGEETPIQKPDLPPLQRGEWHAYYYYSFAPAKAAFDSPLGDDSREKNFKKPSRVWLVWTEVSKILNANESLIERGPIFSREVEVQALQIGRPPKAGADFPLNKRHKWGLIALPCLVAAVANYAGVKNAGYDIEDLTAEGIEHTQERFERLCGDLYGQYKDSELSQRREALWSSLGEDDVRKDTLIDAKTPGGYPSKLATTSPLLSQCFEVALGKWSKPLWVRLVLVPNPNPSEANPENDRQWSVPAIVEIFKSEAEARAAVAWWWGDSSPDAAELGRSKHEGGRAC
jgi:hypothetical protein